MKFLIDNALSPKVSEALKAEGFDSVHVREYGIQHANDAVIFERAGTENRIFISADTDFGYILSKTSSNKPSVIILRGEMTRNPTLQAKILLANLTRIEDELDKGSLVVIDGKRIRLRSLPIERTQP